MNSDNLIGNILNGRYDIIEKIGTGGMATVYKAKDTLLNRFVAVKVLRDSLEGEQAVVTNFIKEAQSSANLIHNNIVSVYDVGEDDGVNYMVMELVDGITLKQYIKEKGMLPWQEACDYAIQIGQGLSEAHSKNIIHRDIKPQNIIMTKDKTLKVTDFGIARAVASETTVVGSAALGSVHYISPEQARGGFTDARSDIYSLGIVLYEMLTGKVPFDGESAVSVALMHLEKEPVNVKCVNMEIPADLAYITMKAIAKEQAARYQNVAEMLDDLHAVLADETLPSRENETEQQESEIDTDPENEVSDTEDTAEEAEALSRHGRKEEKKKGKKKKQKTKAEKKADRITSVLAVVTVLVIALIAAGVYSFMNMKNEKAVPNLVNMTIEEATQALQKPGFTLSDEIEYSLSDKVEEGKIISQNPEAKTLAKVNSEVKVVVSIGSSGGDIEVPDVVNDSFDDAITKIMEANLMYVVVEENSDKVSVNTIIRQLPEAGTKVNKSDFVTLFVSKGRASQSSTAVPENSKVIVPSVTGDSREIAAAKLEQSGLLLGVATRKASSSPEGIIISQSPEAGKSAAKNSLVTIVISSGNKESTETVTDKIEAENKNDAQNGSDNGVLTPVPEATAAPSKDVESDKTETGTNGASVKTFTVKIPDSVNDKVNVEIVANGRTIHNAMHNKSEGSVTVEIPGTGTISVQAYIDGEKAMEKTISFD